MLYGTGNVLDRKADPICNISRFGQIDGPDLYYPSIWTERRTQFVISLDLGKQTIFQARLIEGHLGALFNTVTNHLHFTEIVTIIYVKTMMKLNFQND